MFYDYDLSGLLVYYWVLIKN